MSAELLAQAIQSHTQGQLAQAYQQYMQVLQADPRQAQAHHNLGALLMQQGRVQEGAQRFRAALELQPSEAQYWVSHIKGLLACGQLGIARQALDMAKTQQIKSNDLFGLESYISAQEAIHAKLTHPPQHVGNTGQLVQQKIRESEHLAQGQHYAAAIAVLREASQLSPTDPSLLERMGDLQNAVGWPDDALASFAEALAINDTSVNAHLGMAMAYTARRDLQNAENHYQKAIEIDPENSVAISLLGSVKEQTGHYDEAIGLYQSALTINTKDPVANGNMLYLMAQQNRVTQAEYLEHARRWEINMISPEDRRVASHRKFSRQFNGKNKIRIGYVSGDFRNHAIAVFMAPVFEQHDRQKFHITAYSNNAIEDEVTAALKLKVDQWRNITELTDHEARDQIERDGIDLLVDLSGHTAYNRLGIFALRAAPVQIHYLGYFSSTGLSEMDYWVADDVLAPQGMDKYFKEKIYRLPRPWTSYRPSMEAPHVTWQPQGTTVLGSFNQLNKLTDLSLTVWSEILKRIPNSKILFKSKEFDHDEAREKISHSLNKLGIDSKRILFKGNSLDWHSHMSTYNDVDVVLDPLGGHVGVTTTCDALWMGAPVVTCAGEAITQRWGASLINGLGHHDWIATTPADYTQKIIDLVDNTEHRKKLRFTQRDMMMKSQICDAADLTVHLESMFLNMCHQHGLR